MYYRIRLFFFLSLFFLSSCSPPITSPKKSSRPLNEKGESYSWPDNQEDSEFIADCTKQNFSISGKIEGEPCENDFLAESKEFYLPPEYEKTKAVMISEYLDEIKEGKTLIESILQSKADVWLLTKEGNDYESIRKNYSEPKRFLFLNAQSETIWARDWAPLFSVPTSNYQGEKIDLKMIDTNYYGTRPFDDSISRQIRQNFFSKNDLAEKIRRVSLPIYLEGGNIMCNQNDCFLTDKVIEENLDYYGLDEVSLNDEEQIKREFARQISQKLWFVPSMPYEPTKHIDMWAKFINENLLLINEISIETLEKAKPNDYPKFKEIQSFLNNQATGKTENGQILTNSLAYLAKKINPKLEIVRIPMPVPLIHQTEDPDFQFEIFRSYTNSLLLNGYALVPSYKLDIHTSKPFPDSLLNSEYEEKVRKIYENAGYQLKWIPSDIFIGLGGAIHCITMQVPEPKKETF